MSDAEIINYHQSKISEIKSRLELSAWSIKRLQAQIDEYEKEISFYKKEIARHELLKNHIEKLQF